MTSPSKATGLPPSLPPRLLSLAQAAEYCGIGETSFLKEVAAGSFPHPFRLLKTRRRLWDVQALDTAIDRLQGILSVEEDREARKRAWQEQKKRNSRSQG